VVDGNGCSGGCHSKKYSFLQQVQRK
jgi:hypothetical protein